MRNQAIVGWTRFGPGVFGTILVAMACGVLVLYPAAQRAGGKPQHLNHIIEQFEQAKPAVANEHWVFLTLTNNPFILPDVQKQLASLRVEGARPKIAPIIRIAEWGGQDYEHVVKQSLSAGAMGIIVPEVSTKEQVRKLTKAMRWPPQPAGYFTAPPTGDRGCSPGDARR